MSTNSTDFNSWCQLHKEEDIRSDLGTRHIKGFTVRSSIAFRVSKKKHVSEVVQVSCRALGNCQEWCRYPAGALGHCQKWCRNWPSEFVCLIRRLSAYTRVHHGEGCSTRGSHLFNLIIWNRWIVRCVSHPDNRFLSHWPLFDLVAYLVACKLSIEWRGGRWFPYKKKGGNSSHLHW